MMSSDKILKDGRLHIFLLGSGGPINNNLRVAPSIAVIANGEFVLFDVGPGSYRNLDVLRLPAAHLSAIFLTHFHSDHIGDLGEANVLSWASGRKKALEIYGPEGVEKVVNGFVMAYELDKDYRYVHHGEEVLTLEAGTPSSKTIIIKNPSERELVFDRNELKVYAFEVDHSPVKPALGYRIEFRGKIVAITGDTIKTDNLVKHCKDADILFTEAISYDMLKPVIAGAQSRNLTRVVKILTDIQEYHMEPVVAAKLAKEADVKKIVFVHIVPPLTNKLAEKTYLKGVNEVFDGEIVLGEDNMKFRLDPK